MKKQCSLVGFLVVLICCAAQVTFAGVCAWTGGGDNDNFSTPGNWAGNVTPQTGDTLVFMGDKRTSPVNDLDPKLYTFAGIVFSNTSTTCNAPFTLKGNLIRLTSGTKDVVPGVSSNFGIWPMSSTVEITDTLELDVHLTKNSALGCANAGGHNLLFKGAVIGGGGTLSVMLQYKGTLSFEGIVTNWTHIYRANGNGTINLKSSENKFTATTSHQFNQGYLTVDSVAAFGGAEKGMIFGQGSYSTPAYLTINATEDSYFGGPICINGPNYGTPGGYIKSNVAGKTVTLGGKMTSNGNGPTCQLEGVGDGVFAGEIASENLRLKKAGTGTWTLSAESTSVMTGVVAVAAGTLIVDGDYSALEDITVAKDATLGGTGRVNTVTFAANSEYRVRFDGTTCQALQIDGDLQLDGTVKISVDAASTFVPGREYTLCTFKNQTGIGRFVVGDQIPSSAMLVQRENSLTLTILAAELTWKGNAANNVWDATTPNWRNASQEDAWFEPGAGVVFDDAAETGTEHVEISATVQPLAVKVQGARNYMFTGAGISGVGGLTKNNGKSQLTLANTNTYTGITSIEDGALVLAGTLNGSSLEVTGNGVFTNQVTGRITGDGHVIISGSASELNGTNDFTGGLTFSVPYAESAGDIKHVVRNPASLGTGDITLAAGSLMFRENEGILGRGKTFSVGSAGKTLLFTKSTLTWLGDVVLLGGKQFNLYVDAPLTFGEPGCTTTVRSRSGGSIYVRQTSQLHWYSRLDLDGSYTQTDPNIAHFHAPGNQWSYAYIAVGTFICHCTNTLALARLEMGQEWHDNVFTPVLDLNGYDQTISALQMNPVYEKSSQTVTSVNPAVLTILNDANTTTARQQGRIAGAVTLRKRGTGNWSFGCRSWSSGNVLVEAGTFTVTADDALPTNSVASYLLISPEAKVVLPEGVNATVSCLATGRGFNYPAGVYGGEGCAVAGATIRADLFGPGKGSLRVLHGDGGTVLILR